MSLVVNRSAIVHGAIAMAMAATGFAGLSANAAQHASTGVTIDRTFRPSVEPPGYGRVSGVPYAQHLALATAPAASVLYGIDELSPGFVSAYDLSTLHPLSWHGLLLDGTVSAFTSLPGKAGLLIAVSSAGQNQPTSEIERVAWSGGRLRVMSKLAISASALGPAQIVVGFGLDQGHSDVFALSATPAESSFVPGSVRVSLVQLAAGGGGGRMLWNQPLPDCQLPMASSPAGPRQAPAPIGLFQNRRTLDVGCAAQGSIGLYKPPTPVGAGAVRLTAGNYPGYSGFELFPYPGDATQQLKGMWFPREDRLAFQVRDSATNNILGRVRRRTQCLRRRHPGGGRA
jgi:hypothetical protein